MTELVQTPYGVMTDDRRLISLSDLCASNGGVQTGPFGSQLHLSDYVDDGIPIVTVEHLGDRKINGDEAPKVSPEDVARLSKYSLEEGDIVFSRVGSVDRCSLVTSSEAGWLFSGRCLRVRPKKAEVDSIFLSYFFRFDRFKEHIRAIAVGATMPSINTEIMRGVKVPVPPMVEQRAIAGVLGALDDKIESNSRLICIAKGVIAAEFIRTLESAEGELRFADMFSRAERVVQTGPFGSNLHASDYKDDGVPLILVKHVLGGEIALDGLPLIGMDKVRELASYRLKTNDIVLTRVGRIGDAALVPQSQEGWLISGQMLRMRLPDGSVIPSWLNQWFLGAEFRERIAGYSVGSTRMSLSTGILMEVPFPNVSIEVQRYFDESTSPLRGLITRARAENLTLSGIRDSLLPELLSGRLRVKDAESMMENV